MAPMEKPDPETAERYVASGDFRWNSGIFTWRADVVLEELRRHAGWLTDALAPISDAFGNEGFANVLDEAYPGLDKISIDYALMEHAEDIACVTADFEWDDVGSWDALYEHVPADAQGVRVRGDALAVDCRDSLLVNEGGPLIAGARLEGMTVVSTPEAVLVVPRGESQVVKELYQRIQQERPELT